MKDKKYGAASFIVGTRALIFYLIVIIVLLSTIMINQRSYNDAWILDGISIPTLMFVFFFLLVETFVKGNEKIAIFTASFLVVLNLIPGFKYQLFYNPYDSVFHFGFTNELSLLGYVLETSGPSKHYFRNPGMHIFMGSLSIVSGIPLNEIFKFVMPAISGLIPLIVFFITNGVLAKNVQKYCIIASAFPIIQGYIITGTSLSIVVYFLFLAVFLRQFFTSKNHREYTTIFIILSFALIISHPVTPIVVALLLMGLPIGLKTLHALLTRGFPRFTATTYILPAFLHMVMLMTWWANVATANLYTFADYIKRVLSPTGYMEMPATPERLFEVPFWVQLRIFFVFNIRYAIIAGLSILGLLIFVRGLRQKKLNDKTKSLYMHLLVLIGIIAAYQLFTIGYGLARVEYQRFIVYSIPFCIFFTGLVLWRLNTILGNVFSRIEIRNLAFASVLFLLFSFSLIQFFRYQPLIPKASVLEKDLPENEYLVDIQLVNTVYQREMISFAEKHSSIAKIASDRVTRWQIYGFSNHSFYSRHIWHSPLEPSQDQSLEWDLFLLHTRKAGPFGEQVEYRTTQRIENLRTEAGNLIYDNGESFIISQVDASA